MKALTIAPLSTPKTVTTAVMDVIINADKLFLQTTLHPSARPVLNLGRAFTSMDDLYDSAEDFSKLNRAIADRLTSGESCVYAVMGGGCFSQMDEIQALAAERGFKLIVLAAVSYKEAAFPAHQGGVIQTATELYEHLDTNQALFIEELDDALLAGDVKLKLGEYYPDEHPVTLARLHEDGSYEYEELPLYRLDSVESLNSATVLYVPRVDFQAKTRFGYDDLVSVMERLRAKDGCPWDREQTHESLKRALIEECYELLDAIDEKDDEHIIEELGDVLMQVVFHATIAKEQFRFTERDVSDGIVKKLIFRHPHIFGDAKAHTSSEVLQLWDAKKTQEKHYESTAEVLRSVPKNFPALIRCQKVQKKAAKVGFDWKDASEAFFKLPEEVEELQKALESGKGVEDELSDVFFTAVNLARLLELDSEDIMHKATEKFISRFDRMEQLAAADGHKLNDLPLEEQDIYWNQAKKLEK